MANVDMCEHEWPGSGCKECKLFAQQTEQEDREAAITLARRAEVVVYLRQLSTSTDDFLAVNGE